MLQLKIASNSFGSSRRSKNVKSSLDMASNQQSSSFFYVSSIPICALFKYQFHCFFKSVLCTPNQWSLSKVCVGKNSNLRPFPTTTPLFPCVLLMHSNSAEFVQSMCRSTISKSAQFCNNNCFFVSLHCRCVFLSCCYCCCCCVFFECV